MGYWMKWPAEAGEATNAIKIAGKYALVIGASNW
jgi:hypothetical protein